MNNCYSVNLVNKEIKYDDVIYEYVCCLYYFDNMPIIILCKDKKIEDKYYIFEWISYNYSYGPSFIFYEIKLNLLEEFLSNNIDLEELILSVIDNKRGIDFFNGRTSIYIINKCDYYIKNAILKGKYSKYFNKIHSKDLENYEKIKNS